MTAWPLPTTRDAFLDRVQSRAGSIRSGRRRVQGGALAGGSVLAIALVITLVAGGGAAPQNLRTADDGADHPVVDERHTVGEDGQSLTVEGRGYDSPPGAEANATIDHGGNKRPVHIPSINRGGARWATAPFTPEITDPEGDATNPWFQPETGSLAFIDVTAIDLHIVDPDEEEGDEVLEIETSLVDVASFRTTTSADPGEEFQVYFKARMDCGLAFYTYAFFDRELQVTRTSAAVQGSANYGIAKAFDVTAEVDEKASTVTVSIRLAELNAAMADPSFSAERQQGPTAFGRGNKLSELTSTTAFDSNISTFKDDVDAPAGTYWTAGD